MRLLLKNRLQVKITSPTEATASSKIELRGDTAADIRQLLRNPERADKSLQKPGRRVLHGGYAATARRAAP